MCSSLLTNLVIGHRLKDINHFIQMWEPDTTAAGISRPLHLFVGSEHQPNREAAGWVNRHLAPARNSDLFVVLGMRAEHRQILGDDPLAKNIVFTGPVSSLVQRAVMSLAITAIAPMEIGVGTSLKIPDYLAHGRPLVSNLTGSRSFDDLASVIQVATREDFARALGDLLTRMCDDPGGVDRTCRKGRDLVETLLSWDVTTQPFKRAVQPYKHLQYS